MDSADKGAPPRGAVSDVLEFLRRYSRERLDSRRMDERRSFSTSLIPDLASAGLFGLRIPKEYQGQELSHSDALRVMTQLGAIDANLMVLTAVHNTLGVPPVQHFAPEAVKTAILPELAQGKRLITSAISEPGMGSNLRAISTRATKQPDGSYVINGNKQWISLGADAAYVNVFARLTNELGQDLGITGFLVDTATSGFVGGPEVITLGLKAVPQNSLNFQNLRVPAKSLLGVEGEGLLAAKTAFMQGRIVLAAGGLGAAMRSLELAHRFAQRREVATGNLAENGRIQQILAECVAATQAVEALVQHIAGRLDAAEGVAEELYFAAKILGCELMWQVVDRSLQLLGARGFVDTNVVGQLFRDYRLFRIFEGTTEAVTVYLGTRFLAAPERLGSLLDAFNAAPQVQELATGVAKLTTAPIADAKHRHVLANAVGELACWTILAGLTSETSYQSEISAHTAAWCEQRLRERLRAAERDLPFVDLPTVDAIAGHIAGFDAVIGNVEQRRPGDQHDLDVLLRRG
ncbi:acyl-CoA dehydrogenase family protein [Saccharopolyspora sp. ASAGF58]|uniref:acyl-CoA dehydrogenase family protein n=1 Tax=Saccharopolyspora sp. ASAGF58 TaxID=2719023 RepID=UPI0014400B97|nr:acyl-CoA dehydrogenase family protein [Saccharopolyspora sp. ASAGF58]QIZ36913.1 acyl-CoA dehydrogenase [Saccharopolyspora sp. ASAGF58]